MLTDVVHGRVFGMQGYTHDETKKQAWPCPTPWGSLLLGLQEPGEEDPLQCALGSRYSAYT